MSLFGEFTIQFSFKNVLPVTNLTDDPHCFHGDVFFLRSGISIPLVSGNQHEEHVIWHNDCIQGCLWNLQWKMQEKNRLESYLVNHSGVESCKSPTGGLVREFPPKMPFSFGNTSEFVGCDFSHFRKVSLQRKRFFLTKKRVTCLFLIWLFLFLPALVWRTGDFYMEKV